MPLNISVVIATYHRNEPLVDTIGDLLALETGPRDIVVVDQLPDHPAAVTKTLRHWHELGAIRWMVLDEANLPRARNVGWDAAEGDIVVFVDDDVRIPNADFVTSFQNAFQNPEVQAVAGRVLEPHRPPFTVKRRIGDLGWTGAREPGFGSDFSDWAWSVRGCNMGFRRSILEAVAGFDESFTGSAFREDTDISWRVRRVAPRSIWFSQDAWLYHISAVQGGCRDRTIPLDTDLMRNDLRFARKHLHGLGRAAWMARSYASRVVKAGVQSGDLLERHRAFREALRPEPLATERRATT